jgi:hypothetical protein
VTGPSPLPSTPLPSTPLSWRASVPADLDLDSPATADEAIESDAAEAAEAADFDVAAEATFADDGAAEDGPADFAELPVPSYDSLSLPSLRARLRNLDIPQLRTLADYERSHAARDDVLTMFERRIEKLAAGQ